MRGQGRDALELLNAAMGGMATGGSQVLTPYRPIKAKQEGSGKVMGRLLSMRPGPKAQQSILGAAAGSPAQLAHDKSTGLLPCCLM